MTKRVIVNGALGQMGQEVVKAVEKTNAFEIVAKSDRHDNLAQLIINTSTDIVIDFTNAHCAFENCKTIIENGAHPVIGTTGFSVEQIDLLKSICEEQKLGGIIAPNFSIGAILMMRYASEIATYFPHVEIIELHHDRKADAPSGTAVKTSELIAERRKKPEAKVQEKELIAGARGGIKNDIHIHSIRLPGLVAHQEVLFGGVGQTLTLRHDTYHREAFMPGVILACQKVTELKQLVYGLEHIL